MRIDVKNPLREEERLEVTFPNADVDYTYVATFTQVPGVLVSKEGRECQFRLPHALRCTIDGEVDEEGRRVTLQANIASPSVVAAWWPRAWGEPRIEVGGKILRCYTTVSAFSWFRCPRARLILRSPHAWTGELRTRARGRRGVPDPR